MEAKYTLTLTCFGEPGVRIYPNRNMEFDLGKIRFDNKKVTLSLQPFSYSGTQEEIIMKAFENILMIVAGTISGDNNELDKQDELYSKLCKKYLPPISA